MTKNIKGISPLIASVLLVGFTMAVAAVLVVWITGFTQQQTTVVGQRGENQVKCGYSTLSIARNDISIAGNATNITVVYSAGSETLNITGISIKDSSGVSYVNVTSPTADATVRNWGVGRMDKLTNYILTGSPAGAWSEIRVNALCQNQYTVVGTITSA